MKALFKKSFVLQAVSLAGVFLLVWLLMQFGVLNDYNFAVIVSICVNIILAVSLNLITGFTGQFSLGHAGFMSIGAYTCAIMLKRSDSPITFFAAVLLGGVLACIVGIVVGVPTLRLRGDYLAIATLGMAEIVRILFQNLEITNGAAGIHEIPRYVNWPTLFIITAASVILIRNFIRSTHGRACISIREDEIAAETMGIRTVKYKVMAFAIGAFFAGVAGAVYSSYFYLVKPEIFDFKKSIDILVIVVLGGMGSISGSILAAGILMLISSFLQSFAEVRMIIYSLILILIMLFRPQGIMGSKEMTLDLLKKASNIFKRKGRVQ